MLRSLGAIKRLSTKIYKILKTSQTKQTNRRQFFHSYATDSLISKLMGKAFISSKKPPIVNIPVDSPTLCWRPSYILMIRDNLSRCLPLAAEQHRELSITTPCTTAHSVHGRLYSVAVHTAPLLHLNLYNNQITKIRLMLTF